MKIQDALRNSFRTRTQDYSSSLFPHVTNKGTTAKFSQLKMLSVDHLELNHGYPVHNNTKDDRRWRNDPPGVVRTVFEEQENMEDNAATTSRSRSSLCTKLFQKV